MPEPLRQVTVHRHLTPSRARLRAGSRPGKAAGTRHRRPPLLSLMDNRSFNAADRFSSGTEPPTPEEQRPPPKPSLPEYRPRANRSVSLLQQPVDPQVLPAHYSPS